MNSTINSHVELSPWVLDRFETKTHQTREMLNISWVLAKFETKNAPDQGNVKHVFL